MALTFNETFYLSNNSDVLAAVGRGQTTALGHYNQFGARELRNPNSTFNAREYILQNADLVTAFQNGTILNPFQHYTQFGVREGRAPNTALFGFDSARYLATHADVAAAVGTGKAFSSAMEHYLLFGANESRAAQKTDGTLITGLSAGSSLTMTTGPDSITGTAGNDTITGVVDYNNTAAPGSASTFSASDVINAGAGTADALNLTFTNANAGVTVPPAQISGVEVYNFRNVTGQTLTWAAGLTPGATQMWSDRSTAAVAMTGVANNVVIGVRGDGSSTIGAVSAAFTSATNAPTLTVEGGVLGTPAISLAENAAAAPTTAIINSLGTLVNKLGTVDLSDSGTVTALTISAGANLVANLDNADFTSTGKITVSGTATSVDLSGAAVGTNAATNALAVDASGLTAGGLGLKLGDATLVTVTGGAGNDTITTGGVLASGASVSGGTGTGDVLVVAATAQLPDSIVGGRYTNFEVLQVGNNTAAVTLNAGHVPGITALKINAGAGAIVVNGVTTALATAQTTIAGGGNAITMAVTGATNVGQIDTVNLVIDDGSSTVNTIALGSITLSGVENLSINALNDNFTIADNTNLTALTTMTITGSKTATLTAFANQALQVNTKIDASALTGVFTADASAVATGNNGAAFLGGTANDVITGTTYADSISGGNGNDNLSGAAGNDTLVGGAGADTLNGGTGVDTLTGGDGADVFRFTAVTKAEVDRITDFNATDDKFSFNGTANVINGATLTAVTATVTAAQTIATAADTAAVFAGITAIAASTNTTLSVAVVTVSAGAAAGTYLYINDTTAAVAAADDTLLNITGITGSLTASNFVFAA